jgi:aspartyl-tRNA(Asn)/glutamyl-tRNA(Gln) amidotransferase subunit B
MFHHSTRSAYAAFARRPYICQACLRRARNGPLASAVRGLQPSARYLHPEQHAPPKDDAPFRKVLKDAAKKKRTESRNGSGSSKASPSKADRRLDKWELTVGIEIHAELNTARKLFSGAATSANATPNSHVALFDTAFPGSQPHFQRETLIPALRAALALNCQVQPKSSFDRKHYFYQDQPAGYQITQYYGELSPKATLTHLICGNRTLCQRWSYHALPPRLSRRCVA